MTESNEYYTIESYQQLLNCSKIKEIIITDKLNRIGYIRLENTGYLLISRSTNNYSDQEIESTTLKEYIKLFTSSRVYLDCDNNIVSEDSSDFVILKEVHYVWDELLNDIVNKCFKELKIESKFDYDEFFVRDKNLSPKLYKTSTNTFSNDYITKFCIGRASMIVNMDLDLDFFSEIMKVLIPRRKDREMLRVLGKSMFVKKSEEKIIYYEYCRKFKIISLILETIIKIMRIKNVYYDSDREIEFYKPNDFILTRKPRLVIYDGYMPQSYHEKIYRTWDKTGNKNYLVIMKVGDDEECIYNIPQFIEFIKNNKERIIDLFGTKFSITHIISEINKYCPKKTNDFDYSFDYIVREFFGINMFLPYFFKWLIH